MNPWIFWTGKLAVLAALFVIDLWKKELPIGLMLLATFLSVGELYATERIQILFRLPAAAMLLSISAVFVKKKALGGADAWFLALMGLWMNAEKVFLSLCVALPAASSCALLSTIDRKGLCKGAYQRVTRPQDESIPLIPFLIVGYLTTFVLK